MLGPLEWRLEAFAARGKEAGFRIGTREFLAIALLQLGFVVPSIHLRWTTRHEQPDDRFHFAWKMRFFECQRVGRSVCFRFRVQHAGQSK